MLQEHNLGEYRKYLYNIRQSVLSNAILISYYVTNQTKNKNDCKIFDLARNGKKSAEYGGFRPYRRFAGVSSYFFTYQKRTFDRGCYIFIQTGSINDHICPHPS